MILFLEVVNETKSPVFVMNLEGPGPGSGLGKLSACSTQRRSRGIISEDCVLEHIILLYHLEIY